MTEKRDCAVCWKYRAGFCTQWKQRLSDTTVAETCGKFSTEKILNKGMQIRQKKLDRNARKRAEIRPEQQELVCFVSFTEKIIERINGKYRHPTRIEHGKGLQIKNKIFLATGRYKMVNRSTLKITKRYDKIPEWAGEYLTVLYNDAVSAQNEM